MRGGAACTQAVLPQNKAVNACALLPQGAGYRGVFPGGLRRSLRYVFPDAALVVVLRWPRCTALN